MKVKPLSQGTNEPQIRNVTATGDSLLQSLLSFVRMLISSCLPQKEIKCIDFFPTALFARSREENIIPKKQKYSHRMETEILIPAAGSGHKSVRHALLSVSEFQCPYWQNGENIIYNIDDTK